MKHKKKMNRRERIADYINQRMEGFSKVPNVLADRALKIGALSFLALFLGSYMGRQMDSASFIAWSVVMWLSGIGYAFHLKYDERMKIVRELVGKECISQHISEESLDKITEKFLQKPLSQWIYGELEHVENLSWHCAIRILEVWEELERFIPGAKSEQHLLFLLKNRERLKAYPDFESVMKQVTEIDTTWKKLCQQLKIEPSFAEENQKGVRKFLYQGGAEIIGLFLQNSEGEKEKIRRLCLAEIADRFYDVKYHEGDLEHEIALEISKENEVAWRENLVTKNGNVKLWEEDRLLPVMQIGELVGHTCLSYRDGGYKECLLSAFDANKKVLYLSLNNQFVFRAFIRLTKGTLTKNKDVNRRLQFVDITKEKPVESPDQRNSKDQKEVLTLFLERPYFKGISDEKQKEVIQMVLRLLRRKAKKLSAQLVLSNDYEGLVQKESGFIRTQYYMYISASKNGKQYLDSLGGMATVKNRSTKDKYPFLHSFRAIPEEVLVKKFRAWLLNHGYQITRKHHMKSMGKNLQEDAAPIKYLRLLLRYLEPEDKRSEWEKDVWKLENFGFEVRQNPIDVIRTIKFTGIIQETIREEVKRASYIRIKYLSVGSLQGEIRAVRRFSEFLAKRNPEIKSLGEVGRLNIEEYLTYINLERGQERNLKTEMANLKNMLQQVGKVIDKPKLGKLFIKQDMPKAPEVAFKIYSDEEIKRLNYYIVNMEEQVARALILHQMLGGRISDTLTLRTDCLYQENGHYIVRMYQVKTSYYEKPIPDDVAKLIQKSIEYTYERYGETEYVFVNESNPSLPFQYSMLKHRVYTLIHENDICKDNGERMGFATHLFRHCYGMKLVELHLDDAAIAHLLGHRGVNTVYRYRRASGKLLVKETEELRKTKDEILSEIIKEWDGYEQVFKNG